MAKKAPAKPGKPKPKPKKEPAPKKKKTKLSSLEIVEVARAGVYRIQAPDLLHSIALRKDLQTAIERLKARTKRLIAKSKSGGTGGSGKAGGSGGTSGGGSASGPGPSPLPPVTDELQELLEAVQEVDDATKPIAYGVGEHEDGEDPCEG